MISPVDLATLWLAAAAAHGHLQYTRGRLQITGGRAFCFVKHARRLASIYRAAVFRLDGKMKRLGTGGRLVPFFKCVCVYFAALGAGGGTPSPTAVAAKCAPILCLLLVVLLHHSSLPYHNGWYARRIAAGLALSALGDALLIWPQHFVAGMAAFASAHLAYLAAFRWEKLSPVIGVALYAATAYYMTLISPPEGLKGLVPCYGALLATMAWRGAARGRAASVGAILFLISDAILGYGLFGGPVPYKQVLVMSTYYLGQLGIALSTLDAVEARP